MKKIIGFIIFFALAGLLGWQIYQRVIQATTENPGNFSRNGRGTTAVAVEIADIQRRTIQDIGQFTGSLLPKSQFVVAPKVSGRLDRLLVNIGDKVERNQLIARLEDDVYSQDVEKARAELEVVKANLAESQSALAIAEREFERAKALSLKGVMSQSGLDAANAKYDAAVANYRVAQAGIANKSSGLKTAQVRLTYTEIRASWEDGAASRVVGERFADEGSILRANDPIVSVLDLSSVICVINVIEQDYFRIREDQQATIMTDVFPGETFVGRIARIAPMLQENSRQARVEIDISNPDELLKPGMFVRVEIRFDNIENATVVPVNALAKRQEQQGIFWADLENMTAHFMPVTVGVTNNEFVQILDPELSGSVITMGQYLLEDGASITLPGQQGGDPLQGKSQGRPPGNAEGQ
jgi:RND family efflux transporter MFP subunit